MLTAGRNTPRKDGFIISMPMGSGSEIFAGALVCTNKHGFAVKGSTATDLTYQGRADEHVINTGANGESTIMVRRKQAFLYKNEATDLVDQSAMGKDCYIVDDETVAHTNGGDTRSVAGIVIGIEANGVWVE